MSQTFLQIDPLDNILVALQDLPKGTKISFEGQTFKLFEKIPAKHKFTINPVQEGDSLRMYGVEVGKAITNIPQGARIRIENTAHATQGYSQQRNKPQINPPKFSTNKKEEFLGYHRKNGEVGTMNYWLVIPLVFCENKNIEIIRNALSEALGYSTEKEYKIDTDTLIKQYQSGAAIDTLLKTPIIKNDRPENSKKVFPNVDGIKFLTHDGGCGGIRQDSDTLCRLLAAYIVHPNVAGATVLSLGCQNAQATILREAIHKIDPDFSKPLYILDQQSTGSEQVFIEKAIKSTFVGLIEANKIQRKAAPISKLVLGLECGGSDGFSGISANPALGYTSDLLVSLGGKTILAEFPELNGVEQELINRCSNDALAKKFSLLMRTYAARAKAVGSGFENNPSPGNIKDGLITDAMKSAGAAKKGGTSMIMDVLDYTEIAQKSGLNLLCTPGNDVESTTGLAGSGANIIVFTTGLGTPTGNPICPVIKMSSNTSLFNRMRDIIDVDAGPIISGKKSIEELGSTLMEYIIDVASGQSIPAAIRNQQDDFIPWKRGISL